MKTQQVIWTALPNGFDPSRGVFRLSVFVSPRLMTDQPDPTLSAFGDWLAWPKVAPTFDVVLESGGPPQTLPATIVSSPPEMDLWAALFPGSTYVRPHTFPRLDTRRIRSYRATWVGDYLRDKYRSAAVDHAADYPPVATLRGLLSEITIHPKEMESLLQRLRQEPAPPPDQPFQPTLEFARLKLFHRPPSEKRMPVKLPQIDFHQMVGTLGQYPALLRALGLVFDLEIPGQRALTGTGRVRVEPHWKPTDPADPDPNVLPWTHVAFGDTQHPAEFRALPRPGGQPEFLLGKLPLADEKRYGVIQFDADGTALKALDFAQHLNPLQTDRFAFPRARAGEKQAAPAASLPSLRTTGLNLVRLHRAARTRQLLAVAKQHQDDLTGGSPPALYAEDLVRGYRVDVWAAGADRWFSLHQREGTYTVDGKDLERNLTDEGWVSTGATSSPDPAAPDDLYLHESLLEWGGWSLSAPRPEKIIGPNEEVADGPEKPPGGLPLLASFKPVRSSLPRLRFGRSYRLQARSVDLAGNSPALDPKSQDFFCATPPTTYARFEPVAQPALIRRFPYKESESIEHLVVRSWTTPPGGTPATEVTERHVAPPVTSVTMAERHGMLDDLAAGSGWKANAYALLAAKEGAIPEEYTGEQWQLSYLADPIARGATFQGLPGTADVVKIPFEEGPGQNWPDNKPFRLLVQDGVGAPVWEKEHRLLEVQLPKAEVVRVRLSSHLNQADLEQQLGIWQWVMQQAPPGSTQYPPLLKTAVDGCHWMVTPYREILLIHAVQQPLLAPKFQVLAPSRSLGETFATIRFAMPIHGKSTQKLDLHAEWEEPVDPPSADGPMPRIISGNSHAFEVSVHPDLTALEASGRHEFGDTKHRLVRYSATALTRFPEFFPTGTAPLTRDTSETGGPFEVHVPSSARPDTPKVLYVLPTFEWEKTASSDGSQQQSKRKGNGLRIYLDRPWYSSGDNELLGVLLDVKPKPSVLWKPSEAEEIRARHQTQWAKDPIVTSGPTAPALTVANFSLSQESRADLSLAEIPDAMGTVAAHPVAYDADRKLWYSDLRIEPTTGYAPYSPFVRLALVRYQPYSILDAHLSRVVLADFAQLTGDRTVSVVANPAGPGDFTVSVAAPYAVVRDATAPFRKVEVTVERQDAAVSDLGWTPVGSPVQLQLSPMIPYFFTGRIRVPNGQGQARLVIKEYEQLIADPRDRVLTDPPTFRSVWRLVFADMLLID